LTDTFKKSKLISAQDSRSTTAPNSTTYFSEQHLAKIALMTGRLDLEAASISLFESVTASIDSHDYAVNSFILKTRMAGLLKRKIEIERLKLEFGGIKHIDFLENLREFSNNQIEVAEAVYQIEIYARSLEIAASLPSGGLREFINEYR
jgi:hypothetical protein